MFRPLGDRIVVKRQEAEEKTKSGIYIPNSAKEKPLEGTVLSVGWGIRDKDKWYPLDVEVGDRILFGKYAGTEVTLEEEEVLILRSEEILGVL